MIYGYQKSVGPSLSRQQPSPVRWSPSVSLTAQPDPHLLRRDEHQLLPKPEARVWRGVRPLSALKKDPGLQSAIDFSSSSKAPDSIPYPLLSVRLSLQPSHPADFRVSSMCNGEAIGRLEGRTTIAGSGSWKPEPRFLLQVSTGECFRVLGQAWQCGRTDGEGVRSPTQPQWRNQTGEWQDLWQERQAWSNGFDGHSCDVIFLLRMWKVTGRWQQWGLIWFTL